jgi:hypothetical protein
LRRRRPMRPAFQHDAFLGGQLNSGMGRPMVMSVLLSIARTLGAYMLFQLFRIQETRWSRSIWLAANSNQVNGGTTVLSGAPTGGWKADV